VGIEIILLQLVVEKNDSLLSGNYTPLVVEKDTIAFSVVAVGCSVCN
jgi:hypothetical protein